MSRFLHQERLPEFSVTVSSFLIFRGLIFVIADQVIDEVLNETFLEDPEFTAEVLPTQTEPEIEPENATESKSLLSSIWSQTGTVTRVLSAMSIASAVSDPSILGKGLKFSDFGLIMFLLSKSLVAIFNP